MFLLNFEIRLFDFFFKIPGGEACAAFSQDDNLFQFVRSGNPYLILPADLLGDFFSIYWSAVSASLVKIT